MNPEIGINEVEAVNRIAVETPTVEPQRIYDMLYVITVQLEELLTFKREVETAMQEIMQSGSGPLGMIMKLFTR
jgi:L-lysine 2,3-aminomutase